MIKLPSGVDINNLIDDIRIFSWQAADILLYYSKLIEKLDDKRNILKNNNEEDPVTLADLKVNELIIKRINEKYKNKKIIKIDPGAAFGTGSHPSTYLCLEKMENILFSDKKVLDIGSGSGILSVAARLLGAKEVCAVDNDYLAINSTKSNFQLNFGNLNNLNSYLGSFDEVFLKNQFKQFDFVLCNILAEVIKGMIPNISKCLRNNGEVIFSGILNSQKDEIIKILIQNDLKLLDVSTRKDWACISAQKASNPT